MSEEVQLHKMLEVIDEGFSGSSAKMKVGDGRVMLEGRINDTEVEIRTDGGEKRIKATVDEEEYICFDESSIVSEGILLASIECL